MKLMKRSNLYKANNVTFNPETKDAFSYQWWRFVGVVEGVLIFNNNRYSNTTAKHQSKVRSLLNELGIKIDLELNLPRGIRNDQTLAELILEAEETLCDSILNEELKKQERYERAKQRKKIKKIEDYLENTVHFRDYDILPLDQFGKVNKIAVHQVIDIDSLEHDINNAIYNFSRDGFGLIVFYA